MLLQLQNSLILRMATLIACLIIFAECVLHAAEYDKPMTEIEGRKVV